VAGSALFGSLSLQGGDLVAGVSTTAGEIHLRARREDRVAIRVAEARAGTYDKAGQIDHDADGRMVHGEANQGRGDVGPIQATLSRWPDAYSAAVSSLVSLLATDIVDSTRLWVRYEREMAADLVVHDDAVAKIVDLYGGRVFKGTGDGMMAVFDDPVAAVTAGSEIQRTVRSMSWQTDGGIRVRVAVPGRDDGQRHW
jgi:hypothetical protein